MADNFNSRYINLNDAAGVTSVNTLAGALTLAAGTNVSLAATGNTITISAPGGTGANTTLSNLDSPTAVNQPLNIINTNADTPVLQEMIQLSRTGGDAGSGTNNRGSAITFHDANNPTYTASILGRRRDPNSNYKGNMVFSVCTDGAPCSDFTTLTPILTLDGDSVTMDSLYSRLPLGTSDPAGAPEGSLYYNTSDHAIKFYDGTTWKTIQTV